MAERAKPLGARNGSGTRVGPIAIALFLSLVLLGLFDLVSHAHW
jgi:hypothetical protein